MLVSNDSTTLNSKDFSLIATNVLMENNLPRTCCYGMNLDLLMNITSVHTNNFHINILIYRNRRNCL